MCVSETTTNSFAESETSGRQHDLLRLPLGLRLLGPVFLSTRPTIETKHGSVHLSFRQHLPWLLLDVDDVSRLLTGNVLLVVVLSEDPISIIYQSLWQPLTFLVVGSLLVSVAGLLHFLAATSLLFFWAWLLSAVISTEPGSTASVRLVLVLLLQVHNVVVHNAFEGPAIKLREKVKGR